MPGGLPLDRAVERARGRGDPFAPARVREQLFDGRRQRAQLYRAAQDGQLLVPPGEHPGDGRTGVGHPGEVDAKGTDSLLQQVLQGVGEPLGRLPIEPPLQMKRCRATRAGGVDPHGLGAGAPRTESASLITSGESGIPSLLAFSWLTTIFVVSRRWKGIAAGLSPRSTRAIIFPASTPPSWKSG